MSNITVTVNGQSGPNLTASSGDQIGVVVGSPPAAFALTVTQAGAPGGQGVQGPPGSVNLSDNSPQALGTAAAGVSANASRSDHVHKLPTAAELGLAKVATTGSYADLSGTPAAYTLPAASSSTLGGIKVGSGLEISGGVLSATGGGGGGSSVSLSDSTPEALGTAAAGTSSLASRSDHVHAVPAISTSDIIGLTDALASVTIDVVDGGDYVGAIVTPTQSITITAQPSNQTVSTSTVNELSSTLPSGTWGPVSRVNSQWFVSGYQSTQADYLAVSADGSTWTKRTVLPSAGQWSAIQYANGVYATQSGNTIAYSSDGTTWSSDTFTFSRGAVFAAGGKFLRATQTAIFTSTDAHNWTQTASNASSGAYMSFAYAGGTWFATDYNAGTRVSTDATTWSSSSGSGTGGLTTGAVVFGGDVYLNRSTTPLRYSGGSFTAPAPGAAGQFATNGSLLVWYSYNGKIFTSTNGTTWVERPLPTTIPSQNVAELFYSGGVFALVLQYAFSGGALTNATDPGTVYFTSTNGLDWTQRTRTYPTYTVPAGALMGSYVAGGYFATHRNNSWNYIQIGATTSVAALSVSAYLAGGTLTYQWQASTDGGTTWSNVTGATASTLQFTGLTSADSGKKFRCVVSATGAASVTSNAATLTVN